MAEGNAGTEALELNAASEPPISKRKPESPPLDGSDDPRSVTKTPRIEQDQISAENGATEQAIDKGKGKMVVREEEKADKGKGKMVVREEEVKEEQKPNPSSRAFVDKGKGKMIVDEEEEGSSDDSDEACAASGSDSEFSDDPLMEVDLNNILPSRTRRWAPPVPGAYLVPPDQDDDEDDDDDDVIDQGVVDDDDDDDEGDVVDSESE